MSMNFKDKTEKELEAKLQKLKKLFPKKAQK